MKTSTIVTIIIAVILAASSILYFSLQGDSAELETQYTANQSGESSESGIIQPSLSKTPIAKFTEDDIEKLEIDCSGTQKEIAQCILDWQLDNMIYTPTTQINADFSKPYPIRWNWFLPGIYDTKDTIEINNYDGKIYGICFEYSTLYCSIAEYYNLECRVTASKSKISEGKGDYELATTTGMAQEEYDELSPFLEEENLNYPYEAVRLVASETPAHYWAEIKIDGTWVNYDASGEDKRESTRIEFIDSNDFEVVDWDAQDKTAQLEEYSAQLESGEILRENTGDNSDFDEFTQGQTIASEEGQDYSGITDELGNTNRAKTIDDFMQGKALAPYMASCSDSCDFVLADSGCKNGCDRLDEEPAECYNTCAGEEFFIVCDYICEDASDSEWPKCYKACSGNDLNLQCDNSCWDD